MANEFFFSRPISSIPYTLSQHEQFEMEDLSSKNVRSHDFLRRQHSPEVDWSMETIDRSEPDEECDASRLQTIDELREVLYFHPFNVPKRVPLESFAIAGQESSRMVIVVVEDREGRFKYKFTNMTHTLQKKLIRFGHFLKSLVKRTD